MHGRRVTLSREIQKANAHCRRLSQAEDHVTVSSAVSGER